MKSQQKFIRNNNILLLLSILKKKSFFPNSLSGFKHHSNHFYMRFTGVLYLAFIKQNQTVRFTTNFIQGYSLRTLSKVLYDQAHCLERACT